MDNSRIFKLLLGTCIPIFLKSEAVAKILQVLIVTVVIVHVVELQAVTSYNVTRS